MTMVPLKYTVKVLKSGDTSENRFGDLEEGFFPPVTINVAGWAIPTAEEEVTYNRAGRVIYDLNLFAPPGVIGIFDEVIVDDKRYRVETFTDYSSSPFNWAPGLEQYGLKRVEG